MEFLKYFFIIIISVSALVLFGFAFFSKRFFKTLFLNAVLGVGVILMLRLTAKFTGVAVPLNYYTVTGSALFGLPAIFGFLVANFIFI